jgi:uncharacterized protein
MTIMAVLKIVRAGLPLAVMIGVISASTLPATSQTMQRQPVPNGAMPPDHVWRPAPTPPGAVGWDLLSTTKEKERKVDGIWYVVPEFSPQVRRLANQVVKVNGYMLPLGNAQSQQHFVLMAYPPSCPFCLTAGPTKLMEVQARAPIKFDYDAILIEGRLQLLQNDPSGMFYRLVDARAAN